MQKLITAPESASNSVPRKPHPLKVSPRNLSSYKSSKLSHLVEMLARNGVRREVAAKLLLAGGAVRAVKVRRDVYKLRSRLQKDLTQAYDMLADGSIPKANSKRVPKEIRDYYKHLGTIEALRKLQKELSLITDLRAFPVPDNDSTFTQLLRVSAISLIKS